MRSDPPDSFGVSSWEAADAERGRGQGDPSSAPARHEHPWNSQDDGGIAQCGAAGMCARLSPAIQATGAETIKA